MTNKANNTNYPITPKAASYALVDAYRMAGATGDVWWQVKQVNPADIKAYIASDCAGYAGIDDMVLWDYGFERASYYASRPGCEVYDIDGIVIDALESGIFELTTDCASTCPLAAIVSDGAKTFAGNNRNTQHVK